MDYSCSKFDDCSFSRFGSHVRTDRHIQTETPLNVFLPRLSSGVGVNIHKRLEDMRTVSEVSELQ